MPIWKVRATWFEDDAESIEQWEVSADTAYDAVKEVTTHIRFNPHHIEATLCSQDVERKDRGHDLLPGQVRRILAG